MDFEEIYPAAATVNSDLRVEEYIVWALLKQRKKMVLSTEDTCDPSLTPV